MTGRRGNMHQRSSYGGGSKGGMPNLNRNRLSGGRSNFGGGSLNQVNPWLSQNSNVGGSYNPTGRNFVGDPKAQLALASNLLNNLLSPSSQLNKLAQPPSLLSLGGMSNSSSGYGGPPFNRDRFGIGRANSGRIQKRDDFQKGFPKIDFQSSEDENKRFGNDRKNFGSKKPDNKKVTDEKDAEKKDIDKKEENKIEKTDDNQSVSENKEVEKVEEPVEKSKVEVKDVEEDQNKTDEPKISYSDIPPALFFCHVCRKHMWDDVSFEKHLEGRPHKMMVEELDQSYKLKVEFLRHEMRVMEQQRENDIQRAHRKGKNKTKVQQRGFCTMCNLSFLGLLPAHRKSDRHQRLKKFLHPKCNACSKEFYTRLEWDDHKLTPAHLKKLAEIRKETRPDLEDTEFDITDFIEDINDELETEHVEIKVTGKRESLNELKTEVPIVDRTELEENGDEAEKEERSEEDEANKKLPKYNPGIPVGENFVIEKSGYLCRACNRFILSQEDNKIHCQTLTHFNNIIKILKAQNKILHKRRSNEIKSEVGEKDRESQDEGESDAKRRKMDDLSLSQNGDIAGTPAKDVAPRKGAEKYDPEDPESEPEKDTEVEDTKPALEIMESKVVLEEIKVQPEVEAATPAPKPQRKNTRGSTTRGSTTRGPRARRGRRT